MVSEPTVIKNFIDIRIKDILNTWTLENYKTNLFSDANMGLEETTLTTRYFNDCRNLNFPIVAYQTQIKILETFVNTKFKLAKFCQGIANSITFNNGEVREHTDPVYLNNTITYHCNIISQKPNIGGITYLDNIPFETNETDLLIYPVSEINHKVSKVEGDKPRIVWMFGFSIFKNN